MKNLLISVLAWSALFVASSIYLNPEKIQECISVGALVATLSVITLKSLSKNIYFLAINSLMSLCCLTYIFLSISMGSENSMAYTVTTSAIFILLSSVWRVEEKKTG